MAKKGGKKTKGKGKKAKEPVKKEVRVVIKGEPDTETSSSCRMVAVIAMDGRGQIVLPKSLRDRADMKEGDRFCVVSSEEDDKVCCISLLKADEIDETVKDILGPIMKDIVDSGEKPKKKPRKAKGKKKGSK
jgi:AbrB family looped-hinge helix DNA binding protein